MFDCINNTCAQICLYSPSAPTIFSQASDFVQENKNKKGGVIYSIHQSFLCARIHVAAEWCNLPGNHNILISHWLVGGITRDSYEFDRELCSVFPRLLLVYIAGQVIPSQREKHKVWRENCLTCVRLQLWFNCSP